MLALAHASRNMNKVAFGRIVDLGGNVREAHHAVPVRVGLPLVAVTPVIVCGYADVFDLLTRRDLADPTDDSELRDILCIILSLAKVECRFQAKREGQRPAPFDIGAGQFFGGSEWGQRAR